MSRISPPPPRIRATTIDAFRTLGASGRARTALAARAFIGLLLLTTLPFASASEGEPAPAAEQILERADRIRFPEYGFQVDVGITTSKTNGDKESREYRILSNGNSRTLVQTTAPAIDRGQILLMRDRDLWAFMPNVSQPIRLPLSQKLTGQVANGDLARANFVGDYHPTILRAEEIEGEKLIVLELKAVDRSVTYHRALYWVNSSDNRPYKAEFYALSNRLMKVCYYRDFQDLGDEVRPTRLVMEDALRAGERSELVYSNMLRKELPDKVFNKDYLKKLSR